MRETRTIVEAVRNRNSACFLFHGGDGVGKRHSAILVAKTVLCSSPDFNGSPCCACDNCVRVEKLTHPNIIIIEPEGREIKIEGIRDVIRTLNFAPAENGKRFVIIDHAHRMNGPSANALLKTLEEPPRDTCFILISANPGRLPATVISRCQIFRFPPLTQEEVASILGIPADHVLLPYCMGSVSRMDFYMSNSEGIQELCALLSAKRAAAGYREISSAVSAILQKSSDTNAFEHVVSLIIYFIAEGIREKAAKHLDYSRLIECSERLKSMSAAFYLNAQPSNVLENMLLDVCKRGFADAQT